MRRRVVRVGAWVAVTAAAVALSWYAVRAVLRDTVFEPPRASALAAQSISGPAPDPTGWGASGDATISATARAAPPTGAPPESAPAPPPSSARPPVASSPAAPAVPTTPSASAAAGAPTGVTAADANGRVDIAPGSTRSFEVRGGRASFTFDADSASLIAATPNSGWAVKVWEGDQWLRVDFTRGGRTSSVFVKWNGHPPLAETYES